MTSSSCAACGASVPLKDEGLCASEIIPNGPKCLANQALLCPACWTASRGGQHLLAFVRDRGYNDVSRLIPEGVSPYWAFGQEGRGPPYGIER